MTWILLYSWITIQNDAIKTSVRDFNSEVECIDAMDYMLERFKDREIRAICLSSESIFELSE